MGTSTAQPANPQAMTPATEAPQGAEAFGAPAPRRVVLTRPLTTPQLPGLLPAWARRNELELRARIGRQAWAAGVVRKCLPLLSRALRELTQAFGPEDPEVMQLAEAVQFWLLRERAASSQVADDRALLLGMLARHPEITPRTPSQIH